MVVVEKAVTQEDYEALAQLVAKMGEWDAAQVRARGLPADELLQQIYSHTPVTLRAKFSGPRAAIYLARIDGRPAGCAGYHTSGDNAAEIGKVFVDPEFRRRGVAHALMKTTLDALRSEGYLVARLETVTFMTEAISLYRAFGFAPCMPFSDVIEGLREITVFFSREL